MTWDLRLGDCLEGLASLAPASIDALVTDPPAGIGFMGKAWDRDKGGRAAWVAWMSSVMAESLRVLKPGAHALVWALPRTSHWTATAIEDAGFEIRDVITHHFGSGFPKSLDVSKAIDAAAGADREVVGNGKWSGKESTTDLGVMNDDAWHGGAARIVTVAATDAAKQWSGWGTALKPGSEHWILARKPLAGTVAANVQAHGTGALNIDGCRIASGPDHAEKCASVVGLDSKRNGAAYGEWTGERADSHSTLGRWPANVILSHSEACEESDCADDCPVREMDRQSGVTRSSGGVLDAGANWKDGWNFDGANPGRNAGGIGDVGGASRFFYCPKPSTAEREEGLRNLQKVAAAELTGSKPGAARLDSPRTGAGRTSAGRANIHPTVKSVALMKWLIKLITPPRGLVLDPFAGSGTTGIAALLLNHRFVGWEREEAYHRVAEERIRNARGQLELCA